MTHDEAPLRSEIVGDESRPESARRPGDFHGSSVAVFLNSERLFEAEDQMFAKSGKVRYL